MTCLITSRYLEISKRRKKETKYTSIFELDVMGITLINLSG